MVNNNLLILRTSYFDECGWMEGCSLHSMRESDVRRTEYYFLYYVNCAFLSKLQECNCFSLSHPSTTHALLSLSESRLVLASSPVHSTGCPVYFARLRLVLSSLQQPAFCPSVLPPFRPSAASIPKAPNPTHCSRSSFPQAIRPSPAGRWAMRVNPTRARLSSTPPSPRHLSVGKFPRDCQIPLKSSRTSITFYCNPYTLL